MLRRLILAGLLALLPVALNADGLPFNDARTHLDTKVVVLKLTPKQQLQVSRSRVLSLTTAQRAGLQRRAKGCPAELLVLTNRYDDCTCLMTSIAVWFKPGEVEVPVGFLPEAPLSKEELDDLGGPASPVDLVIDEQLRIWIKGRVATEAEFKSVMLHWQKDPAESKRRNENGQLWIYLDAPPLLPPRQEAKLKLLVSRIRAFTGQNDIDLFVSGFRVDGQ